jgi:DNA-binding transcriptional MerR regulator
MYSKKTVDKRRSIGLASKEVGLEGYILRFWEKKLPQLKPDIGKGARRYYFDKDIENILKVKYLLYEAGYTIKGLKNLLTTNKNLLKKDLETIKKMTKIVDKDNINEDNVAENINNLIEVQLKLKNFIKKFEEFKL